MGYDLRQQKNHTFIPTLHFTVPPKSNIKSTVQILYVGLKKITINQRLGSGIDVHNNHPHTEDRKLPQA